MLKYGRYIGVAVMGLLLCGCSVKRNNFFSRQYHQLTTRYNVYFNGNQALKDGEKTMERRHRDDYTKMLPVFVSNSRPTRPLCAADMDYALEKAAKAIEKHSITAKPRRRKNKNSKNYQTFRRKKEFNNQLDVCYLLMGKAYFYKQKYAMANNTFRFIQRQYGDDEKLMVKTAYWLFRSLSEMGRYDEAARVLEELDGKNDLSRRQREMLGAARADFYIRQGMYAEAVPQMERLARDCRSIGRRSRYQFILAQLYIEMGRDAEAMNMLKRTMRFNFKYEMIFNAKINMALTYGTGGDVGVEKELRKMLRDSRNEEYRDRIYYALGNIEERRGEEEKAVELYWNSARAYVDNEGQRALSFKKLGDHYFAERDYVQAQHCYDSCLFSIDSRHEDYERLKILLEDLTELTKCLHTIQSQDSLLQLASLPEAERNRVIDDKIAEVRRQEEEAKELERQQQVERRFFEQNRMVNRGNAFTQGGPGGEWYFYNPMTIALGKNEFKRKWGKRKLEDNWRRRNKVSLELEDLKEELAEEGEEKSGEKKEQDMKSRDYYLQHLPLTADAQAESEKKLEEAYYLAGELYLYTFDDGQQAMDCLDTYIRRFPESANLPMAYYLAAEAAAKAGHAARAEEYKEALLARFPDSDLAHSVQDPGYFQQVEGVIQEVDKAYSEAFGLYKRYYYAEAERICDEIIGKYPGNKLMANVLFLKAMCVLNLRPAEGKAALERVAAMPLSREMGRVVGDILASMSAGEKPVGYSAADSEEARRAEANRHWTFSEDVLAGVSEQEKSSYKEEQGKRQRMVFVLPEGFTLADKARFKARLMFIHASEAVGGKSLGMKEEALWFRQEAWVVDSFADAKDAMEYLNRVATDKHLLKMLGNRSYRMFFIGEENLAVLKRMKNIDGYVDFFADQYFNNTREGQEMAGKWGTMAHIFGYEEEAAHHFVLALPFRRVNMKRMADIVRRINPAVALEKGDYDGEYEFIIGKGIGPKEQALGYMNAVLKDKELYDALVGVEHEVFVVTEQNLAAIRENGYLEEYMSFFTDNYLKNARELGVEYGDYVYNKGGKHKFVMVYSNQVEPLKLKEFFEELSYSGLSLNNQRFDEEYDYMAVSGFDDKEEAMRYFKTVMNNRKLFRVLRNAEYADFVITEVNLQTLLEKKNLEMYLEFFKKYYLN